MIAKYQIFISSTYDDLRAEREQLIKAVLEMGHIPVGMEMFSAADEQQWKLITRQIDEADYYIVLVAHRYGSTIRDISYTEMEYDYAVSRGVPVLGFIVESGAPWPADNIETGPAKRTALEAFKEKLRQRPIGFWSNAEELHGKVAIALMKLFVTNPRPGWVRASESPGPEVIVELTRLSGENAKLRKDLEQAQQKVTEDAVAQRRKLSRTLSANTVQVSFWKLRASDWEPGPSITLDRLFRLIAPELLVERSTQELSNFIGTMTKKKGMVLRKIWPVPSNSVKAWLSDLMALGLVMPSQKKHAVADSNQYWTLTAEGADFHKESRKMMLEEKPGQAQDESAQEAQKKEEEEKTP